MDVLEKFSSHAAVIFGAEVPKEAHHNAKVKLISRSKTENDKLTMTALVPHGQLLSDAEFNIQKFSSFLKTKFEPIISHLLDERKKVNVSKLTLILQVESDAHPDSPLSIFSSFEFET